jgi:hypothetical protein
MAVMTQSPDPGERRLARPPSARFETEGDPETPASPGSAGRAVLYGAIAALGGVLLTVLLGGLLAFSAGLLVVWASAGTVIGWATRLGGGAALVPPLRPAMAVTVALVGVALGQVGLWWYAGTEGGVLPLLDYLGQTFGVLVPIQALLAAGFAGWAAR